VDELAYNVFDATCPSREAWEHATGRWGALVLGALVLGWMAWRLSRDIAKGDAAAADARDAAPE
jgi:DNA-binding HxlR family transcriptional regulator